MTSSARTGSPAPTRLRVLLGIGGGIAAYKSAELARRLQDAGAEVRVVMTDAALHFIGAPTLQALTGHPVRTSLWDEGAEAAMSHIELARWAQRIVVAPATADLVARLAHGLADDLLATVCLASAAPLAIAPAMNQQMWAHAAVRANIATLRQRGVAIFGPGSGEQACGDVGPGRMMEPDDIVAALMRPAAGALAGRRVLVNAGPTYEDIDPVRFIGNRSSGRMGFAIAQAAAEAGADVLLVAGPVALETPNGVARRDVRSAAQMADAVLAEAPRHDVFVAAAAVADFRPRELAAAKIKKEGGVPALDLVRTEDVLARVAALPQPPLLVGFAAETNDVERNARAKLAAKRLDLLAANRVGEPGTGFESADNALVLYAADGSSEDLGQASKAELARALVARIAARLAKREPRP